MAFFLKMLVNRFSSVAVPYLRRPPNPPSPFMTALRSLLEELSPRNIIYMEDAHQAWLKGSRGGYYITRLIHVLRVTSRVTLEEAERLTHMQSVVTRKEAPVLTGGDEDVTLSTSMKFSLHMPGIEKFTDTPEHLYIFMDLGVDKNVCDDLDYNMFRAVLIEDNGLNNIVFVEGYVQKLDIRRHYTALVCLPPNIKAASTSFMVEPKNGGVVVTIPKQQETAQGLLN